MTSPPPSETALLEDLLDGIDRGVEAHLAWNQKLLRCALLRQSPGEEMLSANAPELCRLGRWLNRVRVRLDALDAPLTVRIDRIHHEMHNAVRSMCVKLLEGNPSHPDELRDYERSQSELVQLLNTLRQQISTATTHMDALTGLPLRHGLQHAFELRRKDAPRLHSTPWLAMMDVDHFKSVNDTWGHPVGDLALKHIAACLSGCLRQSDYLVRYGGEEFLGLFLVHESVSVAALAQRLLESIRRSAFHTGQDSDLFITLTVTIGLAAIRPDESLQSAVDRADQALLQGKQQGRDRFVVAPA
ncbi:MAG: diguanylate cyclase [Planctomycetes bacterium]|nr:diguanylate cyclase [Planctomycetota bacterium]